MKMSPPKTRRIINRLTSRAAWSLSSSRGAAWRVGMSGGGDLKVEALCAGAERAIVGALRSGAGALTCGLAGADCLGAAPRTSCSTARGIRIDPWHFGHVTADPARCSATRYPLPHTGQRTAIAIAPPCDLSARWAGLPRFEGSFQTIPPALGDTANPWCQRFLPPG